MEDMTEMGPTLRCSICDKSFDNRKSQLRHASYCRKARSRVTSRKKACTACTKAKTRCDAASSKCSRCLAKNITCFYTPGASSSTGPIASPPSNHISALDSSTVLTLASEEPSGNLVSEGSKSSTTIRDPAPAHTDLVSSSLNTVEWIFESAGPASTSTDSQIANYANAITTSYSDSHGSTEPVAVPGAATSLSQSLEIDYGAKEPPQETCDREFDLHTAFSNLGSINALELQQFIPKVPKAFAPRSFQNDQLSLNRRFVLCTLRSYPSMMLSGDPPPFIHRYYGYGVDTSAGNLTTQVARPAPLKNCANIVLWFTKKDKDNIRFIWNTIKAETERLLKELWTESDQDAVAALQAMTLYFLLRISEDNEEVTSFDIQLIQTMIRIAIRVNVRFPNYNKPFETGLAKWEDWMLAESLRRTVTVLCLIELLFEVYSVIGLHKYDGNLLAGLSLPCGRNLWKASTRTEWETEYTTQRDRAVGTRNFTFKDLTSPQFQAEGTLDSWLTQLDDLGNLVVAAASIKH
ncbi:uncharacterized protein PAC_18046 [Phialocephala subalpina]|uniref:Zn(2)-C6 fungal-type domain-containing protein n=1 Tax=Phialocephala subalpina TaxID=576137 RepID=A0A1L7XT47_9HELO|nr:uncharacterized protein PAC_18046 [Phialocephala subalpina]